MTANAKPLILADNRLDNGTPTATDTAAGFDVLNLKDLRTYTYWQALSFGTKYITVDTYSAADYLTAVSLLSNGTFDVNTADWTAYGATLASIAGGHSGNCLKITMAANPFQSAIQEVTGLVVGEIYLIGAWVKSGTSGDEAFSIEVGAGTGSITGQATGVSSSVWTYYCFAWRNNVGTTAYVRLVKNTATAGTMLFDEAKMFIYANGAADSVGIIGHNFATAAATVSIESSNDNATWTERLAGFTVATDKALLKTFTAKEARYWRLKIITAAIAPRMAVLMIGTRLDFERYAFNYEGPEEKIAAESLRSETGNLLGSCLKYIGYTINLSFKNLTAAWCDVTFKPLWDSWLSQLKPFFFAPDITNHPTEVYFVKIPDNATLKMPYASGGVRRDLDLTFEGLKEAA